MEDSDSGFSSSSDDDKPAITGNCILCKVRLNQIGISHTRGAICKLCKKKICVTCLSPIEKFKLKGEKVCKKCAHVELLCTPDNTEIDEMAEEKIKLVNNIKRITAEKNIGIAANKSLKKVIESKKLQFDSDIKESIEELEHLKSESSLLQVKINDIKKSILAKQDQISTLKNDLSKFQSQIVEPDEDFWKSSSEVSNLKKSLYILSLETNLMKLTLNINKKSKLIKEKSKTVRLNQILLDYLEVQLQDCKDLKSIQSKLPALSPNHSKSKSHSHIINNRSCAQCHLF